MYTLTGFFLPPLPLLPLLPLPLLPLPLPVSPAEEEDEEEEDDDAETGDEARARGTEGGDESVEEASVGFPWAAEAEGAAAAPAGEVAEEEPPLTAFSSATASRSAAFAFCTQPGEEAQACRHMIRYTG
jgi:hypothetical protein